MMWLRQQLMTLLVYVMWHKRCSPGLHQWCKYKHGALLERQMWERQKAGIKELRTGVYSMTDEELDEHARRF